jgi:hypothetical protein
MPDRSNSLIELTIFTKGARLGAFTKTIKLATDKPESDSKDCRMWSGKARRARITDLDGFKAVIENLKPIEAIAIGRMRPKLGNKDIADEVDIVVKRIEAAANSNAVGRAAAIARTAANFTFEPARPALVLLNHDAKSMSQPVAEKLTAARRSTRSGRSGRRSSRRGRRFAGAADHGNLDFAISMRNCALEFANPHGI